MSKDIRLVIPHFQFLSPTPLPLHLFHLLFRSINSRFVCLFQLILVERASNKLLFAVSGPHRRYAGEWSVLFFDGWMDAVAC